jgi:hypothetical protein
LDGAGVLLFSTHFGREIEGTLFQGGGPTGPIFDRVYMKTYRPSFKAYTNLRPILFYLKGIAELDWSPDGRRIVYTHQRQAIRCLSPGSTRRQGVKSMLRGQVS